MNATKPALHNPDNLTPEQYGASDGWRLLYVGENITSDAQWSDRWRPGGWSPALSIGQCVEKTDGVAWRTRTPDPYAEKPADGWIKMSERKPTEADAIRGIFIWCPYDRPALPSLVFSTDCHDYTSRGWTHWMPAESYIPAPPTRELTQAEKDEAAYSAWEMEAEDNTHPKDGWRGAIAYERAEIAKLIEGGRNSNGSADDVLVAIEARVKGAHD